jgi:hypothetical protein
MPSYIRFQEKPDPTKKTSTWIVIAVSSGTELGAVTWHGAWRQYVFVPAECTVWSSGCLEDVKRFILSKMDERQRARMEDPNAH